MHGDYHLANLMYSLRRPRGRRDRRLGDVPRSATRCSTSAGCWRPGRTSDDDPARRWPGDSARPAGCPPGAELVERLRRRLRPATCRRIDLVRRARLLQARHRAGGHACPRLRRQGRPRTSATCSTPSTLGLFAARPRLHRRRDLTVTGTSAPSPSSRSSSTGCDEFIRTEVGPLDSVFGASTCRWTTRRARSLGRCRHRSASGACGPAHLDPELGGQGYGQVKLGADERDARRGRCGRRRSSAARRRTPATPRSSPLAGTAEQKER